MFTLQLHCEKFNYDFNVNICRNKNITKSVKIIIYIQLFCNNYIQETVAGVDKMKSTFHQDYQAIESCKGIMVEKIVINFNLIYNIVEGKSSESTSLIYSFFFRAEILTKKNSYFRKLH